MLGKVLPSSLGFERLRIAVPDVLLETKTGAFSLDAVSGGIASIVDLTWQLYMRWKISPSFIAVVDEPETHLHPELQRGLLPGLIDAFPSAQFVVATHNPFIISSDERAAVYVLDYNEQHRVKSRRLDMAGKASDAANVLRSVLGIPSTSPIWVEKRLSAIVEDVQRRGLSEESLTAARRELETLGLEGLIPEAIVRAFQGDGK